ncbi:MAG: calcium/sodium antiporter, partial [Gemmatimonadota bacterium]
APLIVTTLLFILGLALLVGGAELLVRGASRIAMLLGIAPLIVGLTVVAFGTSAPELAVTGVASMRGDPDLALGNVVGSNVLNVLLILGASALVAPLVVQQRLVRSGVPFMIGVTALVVVLSLDRVLTRLEGALLLAGGLTYTTLLVLRARRHASPRLPPSAGPPAPAGSLPLNAVLMLGGLGLLVLGSRWVVAGAEAMAAALGVPQLVIGLTVVAAGTSLPELATSVVASARGQRDIAVGNIIGSNIFNLLIVLGAAATLSDVGLDVPLSALTFDLPVMLGVAIACLPIFITGLRIDRVEGCLFLAFYAIYTGYLVLDAADHHALPALQEGVFFVALPLTLLTLAVAALRARSRPRDPAGDATDEASGAPRPPDPGSD